MHPEQKWKVIESLLPQDISGKSVLDLGCNAGYFSIKMKELGASTVVGIDSNPRIITQAKFVADVLKKDIKYEINNIYDFLFSNQKKYDYVLFVGLMYHLRYPLLVLDRLFELTREKLIFQTALSITSFPAESSNLEIPDNFGIEEKNLFQHPEFPKMHFIEKNFNDDFSNWWICNFEGAQSLIRSAGFRILKRSENIFICEPKATRTSTLDYSQLMEKIKKT